MHAFYMTYNYHTIWFYITYGIWYCWAFGNALVAFCLQLEARVHVGDMVVCYRRDLVHTFTSVANFGNVVRWDSSL